MNYKSNKRIRILAVSVSCLFCMVGCMYTNKSSSTLATDETVTVTTDVPITESSESTEPVETTTMELSFVDKLDKVVDSKNIDLSYDDVLGFLRNTEVEMYGSYDIGFGNPTLINKIREYFKDDTLGPQDFTRIHDEWDSSLYNKSLFNAVKYFDIDYVRYVLEENGLRLWTDEIPYVFFAEKFPDYVKICDERNYCDLGIDYNEKFVYSVLGHHDYRFISDDYDFDGTIICADYLNPENAEAFRLAAFMQLALYNNCRDMIAAGFHKTGDGRIKLGLSIDGKYVWVLTEAQYNCFQDEYLPKFSKCENVDILIPETRDDLIASGVDVEKYDEMCERIFGGATMQDSKTQDG